MPSKKSFLTVTDQFCGAGGSSLGAATAGMEVYLALNHWKLAIETHNTNFPDTLHDCADVSATDPRRYPSTDVLITSPECTNHSIAKGARRRKKQLHLWEKDNIDPSEERSRATMFDVPRFAEYHDYNVVVVENVVDARAWVMWDAWIHAMDSLGYDYHVIYFNSMFAHLDPVNVQSLHDFTPQSRDRLYVVFWKKGNKKPDLDFRPLAWCAHCEKQVEAVQSWKNTKAVRQFGRWGRYGTQYIYCCPVCTKRAEPWYFAAFNAIDWGLPAERIGDRERPLKKKTLNRIQQGLEKYGNQYLMVQLAYSHARNNRSAPMTDPMFTQSSTQSVAMIAPQVVNLLHGENGRSVAEAMQTQTARQSLGLAWAMPFVSPLRGENRAKDVNEPLDTIAASGNHHSLVIPPAFLTSINDFDDRNIPLDEPSGTQTTQNKFGVTFAPFMVQMRNFQDSQGLDEALSTVTTGGIHHGLLLPGAFLSSYYGNGGETGVGEAMRTVTGTDRHALVQMPFILGYANGKSPARRAVEELRTIHTENGQALVQPGQEISVDDCYFRMLQPHEIGRGMAFPESYVVLGNKRDQVKQYGNAVTPPVMRMILERCVETFQ